MENQEKEIHKDHALSTQTFGEGGRSSNLESVLKDVGISSPASSGNRKKLMLGLAIILAVGVGVFYYMNREIKGSPDDYVIQGDIIENKRAGLKIQAPQGWDIEKIELLEGSVVMKSQDIEGEMRNNTISPPLTKGCGLTTAVVYKKVNFDGVRGEIENIHWDVKELDEFEEIEINNRKALKNTFHLYGLGPGIAVYFTENRKVYSFGVYWGPDEKQRCIKEFEEMMDRVEID